ncbi:MAG: hypothetical protein IJY36_06635 [Coprobacter sp.]|nr:hypothetical protein [Coprobacter sp.]
MKYIILFVGLLLPYNLFSQNNERRIAILEIVDRDENVSQGIKLMLRGCLTAAVTNTPGYKGLDRVDMDAVLAEHNFQRSGIVVEKHIKQLGIAMGAEYVMVAEAAWFNIYRTELVITAKLIDVETFQVIKTEMGNTKVSTPAVNDCCRSLAKRLLKPSTSFRQTPGSGYIPNY